MFRRPMLAGGISLWVHFQSVWLERSQCKVLDVKYFYGNLSQSVWDKNKLLGSVCKRQVRTASRVFEFKRPQLAGGICKVLVVKFLCGNLSFNVWDKR